MIHPAPSCPAASDELEPASASRAAPAYLKGLIEQLQIGVLVVDERERIVHCNRWLLDRLGHVTTELSGRPFVEVFPGAESRRLRRAIVSVLRGGGPVVMSQALNGAPLPLRPPRVEDATVMQQAISVVRYRSGDGRNHCLVQIQDVSPMMAREARLRDLTCKAKAAQARAQRSAEQLERLNAVLTERSRELTRFAHAAAHDLKAPMRNMSSLANLVLEDCRELIGEESIRFLELLVRTGRRGTRLIEDLLRYADVRRPESLEVVDLASVCEEVVENLSSQIRERRAVVRVGALAKVVAYRTGMLRVLQNLIDNAIKYGRPDCPSVEVVSRPEGGLVRLSVSDDGPGVPAHAERDIFDAFRRAHGSSVEGSGLGLAICRRVVEDCGGTIVLEPGGSGATFVLMLKRAEG